MATAELKYIDSAAKTRLTAQRRDSGKRARRFLHYGPLTLEGLMVLCVCATSLSCCPDVLAITIVRNFVGGSAPANAVGGGNLNAIFDEAATGLRTETQAEQSMRRKTGRFLGLAATPWFAQRVVLDYTHDFNFNSVKRFEYVDSPQPTTMRLTIALTRSRERNVTLDTIYIYVPFSRALVELRGLAKGKPAFVMERGFFDRLNYSQIDHAGFNHTASWAGKLDGPAPPDGMKRFAAVWGDEPEGFIGRRGYCLVLLQVPADAQLADSEIRCPGPLVRAVEAMVMMAGMRRICVQTISWNTDGIRFYERLGYTLRGHLPGYFDDEHEMVWLDRSLETDPGSG